MFWVRKQVDCSDVQITRDARADHVELEYLEDGFWWLLSWR